MKMNWQNIKLIILLFLLLFDYGSINGQKIIVSGYIYDKDSQENLINANVYDAETNKGASTNNYGYFSITLLKPSILQISYIGYVEKKIHILNDTILNIGLESDNSIEEVIITAEKSQKNNLIPGKIKLSSLEIENLPSLLGEKDIIKSLQLLPGIEMGKEGKSGLYVRGGDYGQNLILLDNVPVYNVNHLFNFFSVFTPESINSIDVYKGGFPASYSGRLSSIVDIRLKEGNMIKHKVDLTIGTLSAKAIVEGPIKKEKSSYILSFRRTYPDLLITPFLSYVDENDTTKTTNKIKYHFYDFSGKYNTILNSKNRLFFSVYSGQDKLKLNSQETQKVESSIVDELRRTDYDNSWSNFTFSSRWNHVFNSALFSNTTLYFSDYRFNVEQYSTELFAIAQDSLGLDYRNLNFSGIQDFGLKYNIDIQLTERHFLNAGYNGIYHNYTPVKMSEKYSINDSTAYNNNISSKIKALEQSFYIEDRYVIKNNFEATLGFNGLLYLANSKVYFIPQPRLVLSYSLEKSVIKAAVSRMAQVSQLLVNASDIMPVDLWMPSTENLKPSTSMIYEFGWYKNLKNNFSLSVEGYYKDMKGLIYYKNGESFLSLDGNWDEKLVSGQGISYGIESLLKKSDKKNTFNASYILSWNTRFFEELNQGKSFPFSYDSRHRLKIIFNHSFNTKIKGSVSWVYFSGIPITLSNSYYSGDILYVHKDFQDLLTAMFSDGETYRPENVLYYRSINNYRLPAYHRLDLGISLNKEKPHGNRTWSFSIYNIYARNNPFVIYKYINNQGKVGYKNFSVFQFVPSISYKFIINE